MAAYLEGSYALNYLTLWSCDLARSRDKLKLLYLLYTARMATKLGRMATYLERVPTNKVT